jgi:hypothetical protein
MALGGNGSIGLPGMLVLTGLGFAGGWYMKDRTVPLPPVTGAVASVPVPLVKPPEAVSPPQPAPVASASTVPSPARPLLPFAGSLTFKNCDEVRAAGKAPIRRGDAGYGPHLDRDNDGVACEPVPQRTAQAQPLQAAPQPSQPAVSFRSCAQARAAGRTLIRRGEPGYSRHLDRNNNGIACE